MKFGRISNNDQSTSEIAVIVKGMVDEEQVKRDPAVSEGLLMPTIKKLWIAKASFCEKW